MFPLLTEKKSFLPQIVSQVPSYFTLPMRTATSSDPNVKCYPMDMQDSIFGPAICLHGQFGCMLLADPMTNLRTLVDAGPHFASTLVSQDIEANDMTSKFIFCYSPAACHDGVCLDLCVGDKFNGISAAARPCRTMKLQDAIYSIGGINTLLPFLHAIVKTDEVFLSFAAAEQSPPPETPTSPMAELGGFEIVASTTYAEWKMIQNPVSCFFCLVRYCSSGHKLFEEQLLKSDGIGMICALMTKCPPQLIDVNVLMSVHLLLESVQNQMPMPNVELLECWYSELIFNFRIWSRADFQITIGHIQYISTMVKDDRKYFRRKYGVQFYLDTIRGFYAKPENLSAEDGRAVRAALLEIVKYYIQKELNIKEIGWIIAYISSVTEEDLCIEMLDLMVGCMTSKNCKDQIFLLMHEPQTAELLYAALVNRMSTANVRSAALRFVSVLLCTNRVQNKHKQVLRLHDASGSSLAPGLVSMLLPLREKRETVLQLLDQQLSDDSTAGYCGALHLMYNLVGADISLKLEALNALLTATFNRPHCPLLISKQVIFSL